MLQVHFILVAVLAANAMGMAAVALCNLGHAALSTTTTTRERQILRLLALLFFFGVLVNVYGLVSIIAQYRRHETIYVAPPEPAIIPPRLDRTPPQAEPVLEHVT